MVGLRRYELTAMIYILEDDASILKLVEYTLSSNGYEVMGFDRPNMFLKALSERKPELVLLDIMLPEMSGLDVLKRIRRERKYDDVIVIMLTAKSSEYDKVLGLDLGSDDYIAKPFGMMELLARIKAALRRRERGVSHDEGKLSYGPVILDSRAHVVTVDGHEIQMTLKEYSLLKLLMENEGICLSRDSILNTVWGYAFDGENRTVDVHVRRIREKLGNHGTMIQTVAGVGYRFKYEAQQ